MVKRRPQLPPLAGAMVSWAKEQRPLRSKAGVSAERNALDTELAEVRLGESVAEEAAAFPSQPDILDLLEGNGLIDEDLDELPASIAFGAGGLGVSEVSGMSGVPGPGVAMPDTVNSAVVHDVPDVASIPAGIADIEAIVPAVSLAAAHVVTDTTPASTANGNEFGQGGSKKQSRAERKALERAAQKERRRGVDRRSLALAVVPGLAPTRSKRMGPGRVFDQESAGFSLPDRYENPDPSAVVAVQPLWHLPAPFDRVRLGLRARATLALALGSLVISVLVSTLTFLVARSSFVEAQRTSVIKVVNTHVEAVQSAVSKETNVRLVLINQDAEAVLVTAEGDRPNNKLLLEEVPQALRTLLESKADAASQIVETPNGKRLFVGIKLPGLDGATFFERATLGDVERKVNSLGRTLALVTALSTIGAALVGRSVARQVVRPLRNVADAAAEISSGRLDTRLLRSGDVDLDPLLASFNNMAATLQQRVEREGRFASDVSHELRTPLTALSTAAQLLQGRRDEFSERSQRAVDVLVTQTQHFERLVLDLLEISRFDAGAAEIHREVLHLPEFVRLVVAINSPFLDGDGARVEIPVDDSEMIYPEVSLDKRRVERVVANLLQNAANYGGGAVGVSLADVIENDQPYVRIAVDDDGPGVPEAEKLAIFERFARGQATKGNANSPKGTGLGLALVSAHVALHDGRVWVEDRPDGGARFVALFAVEERVAPDAEDVA
jgi:two-component system, OmpR family, sensor histidine kinase MtrB